MAVLVLVVQVQQEVLQVLFTKHDASSESVMTYGVKVDHTSNAKKGKAHQPLQSNDCAPINRTGRGTCAPKTTCPESPDAPENLPRYAFGLMKQRKSQRSSLARPCC